ncbi:hypothetical protein AB4Y32_37685 [Paraburkholderia phymatum]|uniref:Uncharacterized protein n=1 Tax=Paraburkholderia phymatum TaxID=148447 RepID=A0ACC6UCN5_9BURK
MCYNDPEKGIALLLEVMGDLKSVHGHTALDDFEHFCAYSGLSEKEAGRLPFLWAKYGYLSAWRSAEDSQRDLAVGSPSQHDQEAVEVPAFRIQLGMLLRDQPPGVTAELDDLCVAWWNGNDIVFAHLRDDDTRRVEEEFDLDDCEWRERREAFEAWLKDPKYGS